MRDRVPTMQRFLRGLLLAAIPNLVFFASCTVHAQSQLGESTLRWDEDQPRFRPIEFVVTGVLGPAAMAMYTWLPPQSQPHWIGGILFDDAVRNALRVRSPAAQRAVWAMSDAVDVTVVSLAVGLDSLVIPLLRGSPRRRDPARTDRRRIIRPELRRCVQPLRLRRTGTAVLCGLPARPVRTRVSNESYRLLSERPHGGGVHCRGSLLREPPPRPPLREPSRRRLRLRPRSHPGDGGRDPAHHGGPPLCDRRSRGRRARVRVRLRCSYVAALRCVAVASPPFRRRLDPGTDGWPATRIDGERHVLGRARRHRTGRRKIRRRSAHRWRWSIPKLSATRPATAVVAAAHSMHKAGVEVEKCTPRAVSSDSFSPRCS